MTQFSSKAHTQNRWRGNKIAFDLYLSIPVQPSHSHLFMSVAAKPLHIVKDRRTIEEWPSRRLM